MPSKPLIGINGDFRPTKKDTTPLSWFNTGYYDSVTAAGGLPMLIPPFADDADLKQFVGMLDGLVLAGCTQDLDPVRLGMDRHRLEPNQGHDGSVDALAGGWLSTMGG